MKYRVAEKFKSLQGEGLYTGTPMAFIRFVGCSVGKRICQHCDTDFDTMLNWRGGGEFTGAELLEWADSHEHLCLTGGEPLDQDLSTLLDQATQMRKFVHVETSGTKPLGASSALVNFDPRDRMWICISPKPGFLEEAIASADEIKVIVPGLGDRIPAPPNTADSELLLYMIKNPLRWPTIDDAIRWAEAYPEKPIFLQPRNGKFDIDQQNLRYVLDLLQQYPQFRLSTQEHKILKVQ